MMKIKTQKNGIEKYIFLNNTQLNLGYQRKTKPNQKTNQTETRGDDHCNHRMHFHA